VCTCHRKIARAVRLPTARPAGSGRRPARPELHGCAQHRLLKAKREHVGRSGCSAAACFVHIARGLSTPRILPLPRLGGSAQVTSTTSSTPRARSPGGTSPSARSTRAADDRTATSWRRCFVPFAAGHIFAVFWAFVCLCMHPWPSCRVRLMRTHYGATARVAFVGVGVVYVSNISVCVCVRRLS
jgi:hypothetical protein